MSEMDETAYLSRGANGEQLRRSIASLKAGKGVVRDLIDERISPMRVRVTTEQHPPLVDFLELRRLQCRDAWDEWWNGDYCLVDGPSPEAAELVSDLFAQFAPVVEAEGLRHAAPASIGVAGRDTRVPALAVYEPDTPMTSPSFLAAALFVVEILEPGQRSKEKLDFYQAHGVKEYLEISVVRGTVELWGWHESLAGYAGWERNEASEILPGLTVTDDDWIVVGDNGLLVTEYYPEV